MVKVLRFFSLMRTHWKKTTFASGAFAYGVNYGVDQYEINSLMRGFCEEAAQIGDEVTTFDAEMKHYTVILNPAANRRKAKKNFEKYCAPLLYLSGAYVTILETEGEGHARKLIESIDPKTTSLIVAGGDGTLSETLTGLMRTQGEKSKIPIGILPLGKYNTLANKLFERKSFCDVEKMAFATLAILHGKTRVINTYRVESLSESGEKAVYGVGWLEWGSWPWIKKRMKELWYTGPMKMYLPLLFPPKHALHGQVDVALRFTQPCTGCSRCYQMRPDLSNAVPTTINSNRWWTAFVKKPRSSVIQTDYNTINNELCSVVYEKTVHTTDLRLATDQIFSEPTEEGNVLPPSLVVSVGPRSRYQKDVLYEGIKYINGENTGFEDIIEAKQIEIKPLQPETKEIREKNLIEDASLLIDNEDYEIRPLRVTVLPNSLSIHC